MNHHQITDDLKEIRAIMEKSSKCLTLSGISGILAGLYALVAAGLAYGMIQHAPEMADHSLEQHVQSPLMQRIGALALGTLVLVFATGIYFSYRRAKQIGTSIWNGASQRFLLNVMIPLIAGGIFIIALYVKGHVDLLAPACLIFYGMSLFNAGNYTVSDIRFLGIFEMLIGALALVFPGLGLLFWAIGFGVLHIIYGIIMYFKYERTAKPQAPNHK